MTSTPLPQSTIEYLNNGAKSGDREQALADAAGHYRAAGIDLHIAVEELSERAELDGIKLESADAIIRRIYGSTPPRAEIFHAGGEWRSPYQVCPPSNERQGS